MYYCAEVNYASVWWEMKVSQYREKYVTLTEEHKMHKTHFLRAQNIYLRILEHILYHWAEINYVSVWRENKVSQYREKYVTLTKEHKLHKKYFLRDKNVN